MAESGPGKIRLFNDFTGPEYPVAHTGAYAADTFTGQFIGDFTIKGDLADTDAGVVALAVPSGAVRLTGTNEDDIGLTLATELMFSVPLNGPLVIEARVQFDALTARNAFLGFCGVGADNFLPPLVDSNSTTHTLTATDLVGWNFNSIYTGTSLFWHTVHNGGTLAGVTATIDTVTDVVPVVGEWQVLRLVVNTNGTVEYWIDGVRKANIENAATVTSTDLLCACIGVYGTTSTATALDVDYLLVTANRDWTV